MSLPLWQSTCRLFWVPNKALLEQPGSDKLALALARGGVLTQMAAWAEAAQTRYGNVGVANVGTVVQECDLAAMTRASASSGSVGPLAAALLSAYPTPQFSGGLF